MKISKLQFVIFLFISTTIFAQIPDGFNYQAVARDNDGNAINKKEISVKFSILQGGENGTTLYIETHKVTTSDLGTFSVVIGTGTVKEGDFSQIEWSQGEMFVNVDFDPNGGDNYVEMGTQQLNAVPYAMYALNGKKGEKGDRGEKGDKGDDGKDGAGVTIKGSVSNKSELDSNYQGNIGDMYISQDDGHGHVWSGYTWDDVGQIKGPKGNKGDKGEKGDKGDRGERGKQGDSGPTYTAGSGISISANKISANDNSASNEIQTLSLSGAKLSISKGNSITLPSGNSGGASKIDDLSDGKSDDNGSSIFIGRDAGKNDDGSNNNNVSLGSKSLTSNKTGDENTAIGYLSLASNTNGNNNTAIGSKALYNNIKGKENTAIGNGALYSNNAISRGTAFGFQAMYNWNNQETEGVNFNTAVGYKSLYSSDTIENNSGNYNTTLGYATLFKNSKGEKNTAIGVKSMYSNITGDQNTAVGNEALNKNTTGGTNTAIGDYALHANTEGYYNTAIGASSLVKNTIGAGNTAIGGLALAANTNGNYNTVLGSTAGFANKTGDNNVYIGHKAGLVNSAGNDNIFIGESAGMLEKGSGKLYIENSGANNKSALIYGDFYEDSLRVNGKLTVRDDVALDGELVISDQTQIKNGKEAKLTSGGFLTLGENSDRNLIIDNNEILARKNGEGSPLYLQQGTGVGNTLINNMDGNVGIGLSSPTAKLHVGGDVKVEGEIKTSKDFTYKSPKTYYYQVNPYDLIINQLSNDELIYGDGYGKGFIGVEDEHSILDERAYGSALTQIRLPDGANIKNVKFYYRIWNRGGGKAEIDINLMRREISTPNNPIKLFNSNLKTVTGDSYNSTTMTNNNKGNIINNKRYQYVLSVFLAEYADPNENSDDIQFYGATIEYTLDKVSQ